MINRLLGSVVGIAIVMTLTVSIANADVPKLLKGVRTIVTLGDSITQAGGARDGYVDLIGRYLNSLYPDKSIKVINAGISGHKSTDMQARFDRDVLRHNPDLVTISVGVNDVWHGFRDFQRGINHPDGELPAGVSLELYREKVIAMVNAAQAAHVKVVLLSPTLIYENLDSVENKRLALYNEEMRTIAGEFRVGFIDMNKPFKEVISVFQKFGGLGTNILTTDGVHMNAAGNKLMAVTILRGFGIRDRDLDAVKP